MSKNDKRKDVNTTEGDLLEIAQATEETKGSFQGGWDGGLGEQWVD